MTEKSILPPVWEVPQQFRDRLGDKAGRQRPMVADGHLLLVLHAPPKPEENQRSGRFFWRSADGTWKSNDLGAGINALHSHLVQFEVIIDQLDRKEELATTADEYFQVLAQLAPVHRAARNLHQVLQEARKTCPEIRELINVRDRAYDIQRSAELLFDGTKNALDFAVARRVEEQAQSSNQMAVAAHRLNILAAFFFPIATLTALFGMNLEHGLEDYLSPIPFLGLLVVGLLTGIVLTSFVTRKVPPRTRERADE